MNIFNISETEEWRDIEGFEGYYQVSNLGRVKGLTRFIEGKGTVSGQLITPKGSRYQAVDLWKDNKGCSKLVHRLVAEAFIPNPDNLPEINHRDNDILNNRVDNLEWCTTSYNHQHGVNHRNGYSYRKPVKCLETGEIFNSISAAGRSVNADATRIVESIESKGCCKDFTFVYADNVPGDPAEYMRLAHARYQNYHPKPKMSNSKRVRIVETGQKFDSIAAAARFAECDTATVSNRIKDHRTVNGITFEFVD